MNPPSQVFTPHGEASELDPALQARIQSLLQLPDDTAAAIQVQMEGRLLEMFAAEFGSGPHGPQFLEDLRASLEASREQGRLLGLDISWSRWSVSRSEVARIKVFTTGGEVVTTREFVPQGPPPRYEERGPSPPMYPYKINGDGEGEEESEGEEEEEEEGEGGNAAALNPNSPPPYEE